MGTLYIVNSGVTYVLSNAQLLLRSQANLGWCTLELKKDEAKSTASYKTKEESTVQFLFVWPGVLLGCLQSVQHCCGAAFPLSSCWTVSI